MINNGLALKIGICAAGAAGVGAGSYYLSGWMGGSKAKTEEQKSDSTPEIQALSDKLPARPQDNFPNAFSSSTASSWTVQAVDEDPSKSDTFGHKYGRYFIGVLGNGQNENKQEEKWKEIYESQLNDKKVLKQAVSAKFQLFSSAVSQAFDEEGQAANSLNTACGKAYSMQVSEVLAQKVEEEHIQKDLLKYCSPLGAEPKHIVDGDDIDSSLKTKYEKQLISIVDEGNKNFWDIQDHWFRFNKKQVTDSFFSKYSKVEDKSKNAVHEACKAAYKQPENTGDATEGNPNIKDVLKYCTFLNRE